MSSPMKSKNAPLGVPTAAVVMASFLSGAMICLSAVVIPVLLDTNTQPSRIVSQWSRLYHYGHIEMPALCIGTTGLFGYVALSRRSVGQPQWSTYAFAAATTLAMVPFTWIVMTSTNNILFDLEKVLPDVDITVQPAEVAGLVIRWAWLHAARSVFPFAGGIVGLSGIRKELGL